MYWKHSDSPNGISLRILYDTGDFEVVSYEARYAGQFDADGNVKEFIGGLTDPSSFVSLTNRYFNTQIE